MSKTTDALEIAVAKVIENRASDGERQTARQRYNTDAAYVEILKLIAPRIRHFTRQYGLTGDWEDAEQVCAIAVHRAIEAYDPEKAKFTTFVNWQLRGELQSLRFRLMTDQRSSAQKVGATTISLHSTAIGPEGEQTTLDAIVEDEEALERTEEGVADFLVESAASALIDAYIETQRKAAMEQLRKRARTKRPKNDIRTSRPDLPVSFRAHAPAVDKEDVERLTERLDRDREIIERWMFEADTQQDLSVDLGLTRERVRQITRKAAKGMAEIAATDPRFEMLAELAERKLGRKAAKPEKAPKPDEDRTVETGCRATRVSTPFDRRRAGERAEAAARPELEKLAG